MAWHIHYPTMSRQARCTNLKQSDHISLKVQSHYIMVFLLIKDKMRTKQPFNFVLFKFIMSNTNIAYYLLIKCKRIINLLTAH